MMTYEQFEAEAKALGFPVVLERRWSPGAVAEEHGHAFDVRALVVQGELWLTVGGATRHLRSGDPFELARDVPHAERYGPEGATYWVGRRE